MLYVCPGFKTTFFIVQVCLSSLQTGNALSDRSGYVIPALPFFFIWISKVGRAISWKRPMLSILAATLLLWSVGSSFWVYPHSISYFNGLAAVLPTPKDTEYPKPPETPKGLKDSVKRLLDAGLLNAPRHCLREKDTRSARRGWLMFFPAVAEDCRTNGYCTGTRWLTQNSRNCAGLTCRKWC